MPIADLLFAAVTYPNPTTDRALRSAVALTKRTGGELSVLSLQVRLPALHHGLGNAVLQLDEMLKREESISAATAQLQRTVSQIAAEDAGVIVHNLVAKTILYEESPAICAAARTRDICLAVIDPATFDTSLIEPLLVGSGRPLLIFPEASEVTAKSAFETAVIAWDNGPHAARAVADAMPLLQRAGRVFVVVVTDDKPQADKGSAGDLIRHLGMHSIQAVAEYQPAEGQRADKVIRKYVAAKQADILIMGGFGHSRLREFVLGGVTSAMLKVPPCPTLISH